MSSFKIHTGKSSELKEKLDDTSSGIKMIAEDVKSIKNVLALSGSAGTGVKSHMGELYQKIMDEAVHMERFSDALEHIVQSYKKYEDKIAGNIGYEPVSSDLHSVPEEDATGTEKRGWWSRFWDWVWKKEVDPVYTATTEEQEQAADRRFQQEIEVLMESDRFSEERWSEASVEERQQMLEDYMNEVAAILGVDVKSEINFTNKPPEDGKILNGSYTHGRKQVEINSYIIENIVQPTLTHYLPRLCMSCAMLINMLRWIIRQSIRFQRKLLQHGKRVSGLIAENRKKDMNTIVES